MLRARPYRPTDDIRETPRSFFDPLHAKNHYTIDACALPKNTKCTLFYSPDGLREYVDPQTSKLLYGGVDGLTGPYTGQRVWANVPFSQFELWLPWAWKNSDAELVTMLAPATRTDRPWWHRWVEPYRDDQPERRCPGGGEELRINPPGFEHPTWRLNIDYTPGRIDFLEDGHPVYRRDKKGELVLKKVRKHDTTDLVPIPSTAMFGLVLLEWRHV